MPGVLLSFNFSSFDFGNSRRSNLVVLPEEAESGAGLLVLGFLQCKKDVGTGLLSS